MVLLSTHNISFGFEIGKIIYNYALLSGRLLPDHIHLKSAKQPSQYIDESSHSQESEGSDILILVKAMCKYMKPIWINRFLENRIVKHWGW